MRSNALYEALGIQSSAENMMNMTRFLGKQSGFHDISRLCGLDWNLLVLFVPFFSEPFFRNPFF